MVIHGVNKGLKLHACCWLEGGGFYEQAVPTRNAAFNCIWVWSTAKYQRKKDGGAQEDLCVLCPTPGFLASFDNAASGSLRPAYQAGACAASRHCRKLSHGQAAPHHLLQLPTAVVCFRGRLPADPCLWSSQLRGLANMRLRRRYGRLIFSSGNAGRAGAGLCGHATLDTHSPCKGCAKYTVLHRFP